MGVYKKLYGYFKIIKYIGVIIAGIGLFAMMLFISLEVILRNFFQTSIPGNYEIVENYLMPLVTFPILVYALSSGVLPRINLIVHKLGGKVQRYIFIILLTLELLIIGLLVYYTFQHALSGTQQGVSFSASGSMYPLFPFLYLVPFGFGLLGIEVIFLIIKNLTSKNVAFIVEDHLNLD